MYILESSSRIAAATVLLAYVYEFILLYIYIYMYVHNSGGDIHLVKRCHLSFSGRCKLLSVAAVCVGAHDEHHHRNPIAAPS